jgi:hypothetical protein
VASVSGTQLVIVAGRIRSVDRRAKSTTAMDHGPVIQYCAVFTRHECGQCTGRTRISAHVGRLKSKLATMPKLDRGFS